LPFVTRFRKIACVKDIDVNPFQYYNYVGRNNSLSLPSGTFRRLDLSTEAKKGGRILVPEKKKEQQGPVGVPIEWHFPEGIVTRYANNMLVQFGDHDCYLSFFEIPVPVILGTPEEQQEELKKINKVKAECVARIAIPSSKMPDVVEALKTTLAAHLAKPQGTPQASGEKS
jgi:hypothetical protein